VKVLIVGFGSIGKRHFDILNSMQEVKSIDLVTKQNIEGVECFSSLQGITSLDDYDYFIVSSETVKHFEQLKYLCSKVMNKKILVEKPLYNRANSEIALNNNDVYTAYNLRFHPVLQRLKSLVVNQDIYSATVFCGQYLPAWRPGRDYRESYSAHLTQGGGVLRDLSHELDYTSWLFGALDGLQCINTKRSDLEIQSDDIFTAVGVTKRNVVVNITLDYISKHPIRQLIIHTQDLTIEADVIKGCLVISDRDGVVRQENIVAEDRNYTYRKMHQAVLGKRADMLCSFAEGLAIVSAIDAVPFQEMT